MAGDPPRLRSERASFRPALLLGAFLALAALVWLGWQLGGASGDAVTARPALWRVSKDGREAYLFGTIHAVPRGERWLSPRIAQAVLHSDRLILEVTGLEAERRSQAIFDRLGQSPGLPPVEQRLVPADAAHYRTLEEARPSAFRGLDGYESWAAALLINAGASSGLSLSPDNAGEAVLTRSFTQAGKPVQGLETITGQLGLFDALPEADQRLLLAQAVREAEDAPRLYADLHDAWAKGDVARLESQFLAPLDSSPGLRHVLIDERNRQWSRAIDADAHRAGTPFIAVGAGHLLGRASVQARLAELGWRVERLQ